MDTAPISNEETVAFSKFVKFNEAATDRKAFIKSPDATAVDNLVVTSCNNFDELLP